MQRTAHRSIPGAQFFQRPLEPPGLVPEVVKEGHLHREGPPVAKPHHILRGQVDKLGHLSGHSSGLEGIEEGHKALQLLLLLLAHGQLASHRRGERVESGQHRPSLGQGGISLLQQFSAYIQQPPVPSALQYGHRGALGHLEHQRIGQLTADGDFIHIGELCQYLVGHVKLVELEEVFPLLHAGGGDDLRLGIADILEFLSRLTFPLD